MKSADEQILNKILRETEYLQTKVGKVSLDDFVSDETLKRAAAMSLLNIGELAKRLSKEFQDATSDIPYHKMIALRNLAAHGYFEIRFDDIWKTITTQIPILRNRISEILNY